MHRLKGAGELPALAVLHHQRVYHHIGEGQPEPHRGEQERHAPRGIGGEQTEREAGGRRHCTGHDQVTLTPAPEQGDPVREQAIGRLDQPGQRGHGKEAGDLGRRIAEVFFQHEGDRLRRQVPHALCEVDHREDERQPARLSLAKHV